MIHPCQITSSKGRGSGLVKSSADAELTIAVAGATDGCYPVIHTLDGCCYRVLPDNLPAWGNASSAIHHPAGAAEGAARTARRAPGRHRRPTEGRSPAPDPPPPPPPPPPAATTPAPCDRRPQPQAAILSERSRGPSLRKEEGGRRKTTTTTLTSRPDGAR